MTRNQIAYFEANERRRSNLRNEQLQQQASAEVARHNTAVEAETYRSNVVNSSLGFAQLAENRRHNYVTEATEKGKAAEVSRHNLVTENQQQFSLMLTQSALNETKRSNLANEEIKRAQVGATITAANISASASRYAAQMSASASRYAADTNAATSKYVSDNNYKTSMYNTNVLNQQRNLDRQETIRHNKETESISKTNSLGGLISSFGSLPQTPQTNTQYYGPNVVQFPKR